MGVTLSRISRWELYCCVRFRAGTRVTSRKEERKIMAVVFWIAYSVVLAAWAAAEWMIFRKVASVCHDSTLPRRSKVCAVAMAVADIPLVCLSTYACFCAATIMPTPNGHCLHFGVCPEVALNAVLTLPLALAYAPINGLLVGLGCILVFLLIFIAGLRCVLESFLIFLESLLISGDAADKSSWNSLENVGIGAVCALSAFYLLVGAFMRGKIMWRAPDGSRWRAVFVFFATYWPHMLLLYLLTVAEDVANVRGGECSDLLL